MAFVITTSAHVVTYEPALFTSARRAYTPGVPDQTSE